MGFFRAGSSSHQQSLTRMSTTAWSWLLGWEIAAMTLFTWWGRLGGGNVPANETVCVRWRALVSRKNFWSRWRCVRPVRGSK